MLNFYLFIISKNIKNSLFKCKFTLFFIYINFDFFISIFDFFFKFLLSTIKKLIIFFLCSVYKIIRYIYVENLKNY